jgi:putative ABC transport system permease protein
MKRTLRVLSALTAAAFTGAGCERSSRYAEPPASSYSVEQFTLSTEVADTVTGAVVSPEFFTASNVRPWLGRFFFESEYSSAAKPVVVISNKLWRRRFNAAPQILGTVVSLNGRAMNLIGVAPPDFEWPKGAEVWVPRIPR